MKLLAIDGNSIMNRAFYGIKLLSNQKGVYTNALFGFLNIYLKLKRELQPDAVAVTFDLHAPTFRHKRYEAYKGTRKGMPDELRVQMPLIKQILAALGCPILELAGYEADDILGTLAASCDQAGWECVVATGDRDCLQLCSPLVTVLLVKTKENIPYSPDRVVEDFGITPAQVIELKALMGDASDNIPGVKGIGEKTALSLLAQSQTIDRLYENLNAFKLTPRVRKLLEDDKENAFLSRELATICTQVPIDAAPTSYLPQAGDPNALTALLTDLELFSFIDKFNLSENLPSVAEQSAPIAISVINDPMPEQVLSALKGSPIDFLLNDTALLVNDDRHQTVYCFGLSRTAAIQKLLWDSPNPKRTFMAKAVYKLASEQGQTVDLLFDLELAAYLLSPSTKGYDLDTLALHHLTGIQVEVAQEYRSIALLTQLCDKMTAEIHEQGLAYVLNEIELPLCRVLADMECGGFAIDSYAIDQFGQTLKKEITSLTEQIMEFAGETFNPNSTKELGSILFEKLGLPSGKKTKTGYSTNVEVLNSLVDKHPIIQCILDYRQLTKLHSTYIVGLLKVCGEDGRVHSTFNQTLTRTGRISSTEPNVQNIPIRTELGSEIRRFFVAKEGYTLVDADYSQIELRVLAHIAKDSNMIDAFAQNKDIHRITASQVFHVPFEDVSPALRSRAKAINFGIVYGIGAYSLSRNIHTSVAEGKAYIHQYLTVYHGVDTYMKAVVEQARKDNYVTTLYGRKRDVSDINSSNKITAALGERIALNTPIQGTAADIIKLAMVRVYNRLRKEDLDARLLLQVHDELIIECRSSLTARVKELLKEEMERAADLSVKLRVDVNSGENWLEAH